MRNAKAIVEDLATEIGESIDELKELNEQLLKEGKPIKKINDRLPGKVLL